LHELDDLSYQTADSSIAEPRQDRNSIGPLTRNAPFKQAIEGSDFAAEALQHFEALVRSRGPQLTQAGVNVVGELL
jgi:hypothetical protein